MAQESAPAPVIPRRYPPVPLVGVAAAVFDATGHVLLVQRGQPPRQGQWGLPGGLLDLGERLETGVRREVREECGIEIEVMDLVAAFEPIQRDDAGRVEYHYVVLDYWARHVSGTAVAADDAAALAWVTQDGLDAFHLSADTADVVRKAFAMRQRLLDRATDISDSKRTS
ncbi:MAG: NUDIX domain-containing protein [Caldilineaceae bacterium]|nr:NUDIX domain-containing protein [Caldilineaceae bacterium]